MKNRSPRDLLLLPSIGLIAILLLLAVPGDLRAGNDSSNDLDEQGWILDRLDLTGTERPGVRHVHANGRFRLPADQVWEAIAGKDKPESWPGIREVIIEDARGDTTIRRYALDVPIYPDRTYRLRVIRDEESMRLLFDRIPGYGNVNEIRGAWQVRPLSPFETEVTYTLDTDPGVKLVPGFIVTWATKKVIPRSFAHIYEMATGGVQQTMKLGRPNPSAY